MLYTRYHTLFFSGLGNNMQNSDEFITWLTTLTNLVPKHGYLNAQTALIKLRSLKFDQSIIPKKKFDD
ncbi:MAG: hypothetical protein AB4063_20185 [Crocosphaera sp.]